MPLEKSAITNAKLPATEPTVFAIDDDADLLKSLRELGRSVGLRVAPFLTADDFLQQLDLASPGCIVTDLRMPKMDGLTLQQRLLEREVDLPIIFLTGFSEVPAAVQALKAGAFDFIEKPFRPTDLLAKINAAITLNAEKRMQLVAQAAVRLGFESLSPREREVTSLLVSGKSNKQISAELKISLTTVDFHRHNIFGKLKVENAVQLARLYDACN